VNAAITEASDYLRELLEERRLQRRDDVISHLLTVQERGAPLSDEDIIAECLILLVAGHESTVNLIANAALALLEHPEEAERLRSGRCRIEDAIEEFLRYDGPSRWITRVASAPLNIGGKAIAPGDLVVILVGAANRDPLRFSQPDRLDLTRRDVRHLGFGAGIHYCEGASFGRLGAEVALSTLLQRMPALSLRVTRSELTWREDFHVRSLRSLPVRF
jgi:cytochrome P450